MTSLDLLLGLAMLVLAIAAAIWVMLSGGSDRAVFLLLVSVVLFIWIVAIAYSHQQADDWLSAFPGPVVISAPTWQRVLLCLTVLLLTAVPFFGGVIIEVRRGDWEVAKVVVACIFGLVCAIGALMLLPRRELVLSLDRLEYRSFRRIHSYRWSEFSGFRVFNAKWSYLLCELTHQSHRRPVFRRSLMIAGPLGVSNQALKTLLTEWQERALAGAPVPTAVSLADAPRSRSLLDYA